MKSFRKFLEWRRLFESADNTFEQKLYDLLGQKSASPEDLISLAASIGYKTEMTFLFGYHNLVINKTKFSLNIHQESIQKAKEAYTNRNSHSLERITHGDGRFIFSRPSIQEPPKKKSSEPLLSLFDKSKRDQGFRESTEEVDVEDVCVQIQRYGGLYYTWNRIAHSVWVQNKWYRLTLDRKGVSGAEYLTTRPWLDNLAICVSLAVNHFRILSGSIKKLEL